MNKKRGRYPLIEVLALFLMAFSCICGDLMAEDKAGKMMVTVEIFSGRPNPTFEITGDDQVAQLREAVTNLPEAVVTAKEVSQFNCLGYRGIIIRNPLGIEGIPAYVQALNGRVKMDYKTDIRNTKFFLDVKGIEMYYLNLAKKKGIIPSELLEKGFLP